MSDTKISTDQKANTQDIECIKTVEDTEIGFDEFCAASGKSNEKYVDSNRPKGARVVRPSIEVTHHTLSNLQAIFLFQFPIIQIKRLMLQSLKKNYEQKTFKFFLINEFELKIFYLLHLAL